MILGKSIFANNVIICIHMKIPDFGNNSFNSYIIDT